MPLRHQVILTDYFDNEPPLLKRFDAALALLIAATVKGEAKPSDFDPNYEYEEPIDGMELLYRIKKLYGN